MLAKVSSFLGPNSLYNMISATPSLVLSLDAAGYTGSGVWTDSTGLHNDGISDGMISWSADGGGSFNFDGSSAYFYFDNKLFDFDSSPTASYGISTVGNSVTSIESSGNWTTKQAVSVESYTTKVKIKFQTGANPYGIICGLSDKPYSIIDNYSKPNYGFYINNPSFLTIVEDTNFNINITVGTYSENSLYEIIWDGKKVKYYLDGFLFYTSTTTPTNPLYLYCTFNPAGQEIKNIEFGPYVEAIPLGGSNYTTELWLKSNSYSYGQEGSLVSWGDLYSPGFSNVVRLNNNGFRNYWWANDIVVEFSGTQSLFTDNWYYLVATYDGTYRKIYLNGNQVALDTPLSTPSVNNMTTLKIGYDGINFFNGKISKLKIHSKALLNDKILTNFNDDKIRHGYVFGSMTFSSNDTSYLITTSSDYVIGTNDYTLEAFFNCGTYSDSSGIVSLRDSSATIQDPSGTGLSIGISNTGGPLFTIQGTYHTGLQISLDRWYHVAMSRIGGTTSCYINGVFEYEFSDTYDYQGQDLAVGRFFTNSNELYFDGIISNVRLINGTGIYSGTSFNTPTTPLSSVTNTELLIISQQTSPTIDVSGFIPPASPHLVTNNNVGWTSSTVTFEFVEFDYQNFASTAGLELISIYNITSNYIYLTNNTNSDVGNIYTSTSTNYERNFSLEFNIEVSGGNGADGFCVQWTNQNTNNGGVGGDVGADFNSINLFQFKTYGGNTIYQYQTGVNVASQTVSPFNMRQNVYYWMDYDFNTFRMYISYATTNVKPLIPQHTFTSVVFDTNNYYFGIGAATGGSNDYHILKSLKLTFI